MGKDEIIARIKKIIKEHSRESINEAENRLYAYLLDELAQLVKDADTE